MASKRIIHSQALSVICLIGALLAMAAPGEWLTLPAQEQRVPGDPKTIFTGKIPTTADDLKAMQQSLQSLAARVIPTTVAVQVGVAQGSGVIVSPEGLVLTAAHVVGKPGAPAQLILHNGRRVNAKSLGVFRTVDAGMLKIDDEVFTGQPTWPYARLGDSRKLQPGQWCLATGHPGGFQATQTPVVRVGRILSIDPDAAVTTDCTLIGGDSGGPLFDMEGNVIGIHSRIGGPLTVNLHVPVQAYVATWDRLLAGEAWGYPPGQRPYIGVQGDAESAVAKVSQVFRGSAADKAGIRVGDVIVKFGDKEVTDFESLKNLVEAEEPGRRVPLEVLRDENRVRMEIVVGRQRD